MHERILPLSEAAKSIKLGTYRHYKGGRYQVLCVGRMEDDGAAEVVVYRSLQHDEVWVRPVTEFLESVERGSYSGPRYTLIAA